MLEEVKIITTFMLEEVKLITTFMLEEVKMTMLNYRGIPHFLGIKNTHMKHNTININAIIIS